MLTDIQTQLKDLANSNPTAKLVFEALSRRERAREATNLNWFKYFLTSGGQQVASDQYIGVFKTLETLNVGKLISPKKNKSGQTSPARFIWNYNLKDIARAANGTLHSKVLRPVEKEVEKPSKEKPVEKKEVATAQEPFAGLKDIKPNNNISINRAGIAMNIDLDNLPSNVKAEDVTAWLSLVKELEK